MNKVGNAQQLKNGDVPGYKTPQYLAMAATTL